MPTTRSASKTQKSLDSHSGNAPSKRKAENQEERLSKRSKPSSNALNSATQTHPTDASDDLQTPILINRSPVLQLWSATVAKFVHPDEDWTTCLGIGGSVSSLCAISKGRTIGKIDAKDPSAKLDQKNKKQTREVPDETRHLEVMGFTMETQAGAVVVDGKKKPVNEHLLQTKFGGKENYNDVKQTMERALRTWQFDKEQLDKKAFHMYERFRPNIATGSAGWGRKGSLNLQEVRDTIESRK